MALARDRVDASPDLHADDMRGVWISTTDPAVVEEVRALLRQYFPAIEPSHVGGISAAAGAVDAAGEPNHVSAEKKTRFEQRNRGRFD